MYGKNIFDDPEIKKSWMNYLVNCSFDINGDTSTFGWDNTCVRYSHFHMEIFQQLTALPKWASISLKIGLHIFGCIIYKMAYSLRQSLPPKQKTVTLNTVNTHLCTSLCCSLCMCLIVMSQEFLVREQYVIVIIIWNLYFIAPIKKKHTGIHIYETENFPHLNYHSSFHIVCLTCFIRL